MSISEQNSLLYAPIHIGLVLFLFFGVYFITWLHCLHALTSLWKTLQTCFHGFDCLTSDPSNITSSLQNPSSSWTYTSKAKISYSFGSIFPHKTCWRCMKDGKHILRDRCIRNQSTSLFKCTQQNHFAFTLLYADYSYKSNI